MLPKVIQVGQGLAGYPVGFQAFFHKMPSRLWFVGQASILDRKLLGIISSRTTEDGLALKSSRLLRQLGSPNATFIGGWHSPPEQEALEILLAQPSRIIFCLAKSLNRFIPSAKVEGLLRQGRGLLLTHCSPNARRISRDASLRRNQVVVGLARGILVLSGPEGSASFQLAQVAIKLGRPVFTPDHPINERLLASGGLPATLENIQTAFK